MDVVPSTAVVTLGLARPGCRGTLQANTVFSDTLSVAFLLVPSSQDLGSHGRHGQQILTDRSRNQMTGKPGWLRAGTQSQEGHGDRSREAWAVPGRGGASESWRP